MEKADCIVVGAGVIGLAAARALALAGREVIVLEAGDCIGGGISSRNSEVIHAGIYYPRASLKALHCVRGRQLLYDYCETRRLPFQRCGKLIIATETAQLQALQSILEKGRGNGVDDLVWLDRAEVQRREPAINCVAALWSPSTGIIDSHAYMLALQADLENAGGMVVFDSAVQSGSVTSGLLQLQVQCGDSRYSLGATTVINCAGLGGDRLAQAIDGIRADALPRYRYAKGNYFTCAGQSPFSSLIYPVPGEHGLGVHDVEWVEQIDYAVDPRRSDAFYAAIRQYWPDLPDGSLQPAYSGIRPKLNGSGLPAADFVVQGEREHGIAGLVNLFGIESPGLTSSLALAEQVAEMAALGRL